MTMEYYRHIMDVVGTSVDGIGVFIIIGGALVATARLVLHRVQDTGNYYSLYRQDVGRAILLGLEFLIAGDIIRTVVVAPTMQNVLVLGLIVLMVGLAATWLFGWWWLDSVAALALIPFLIKEGRTAISGTECCS